MLLVIEGKRPDEHQMGWTAPGFLSHYPGRRNQRIGTARMNISMIGLDTAKSVFQVHGVDESGKAVLKRKLQRSEMVPFFEKLPPCTVVLEACGAAHFWARTLIGLGHDAKLIAPEAVRPFVKKRKKNDAADAEGLVTAGRQPGTRFVPVKDTEQQGILAIHTSRAILVKQQTMLSNSVRGQAAEFGHTAAKGNEKLAELVTEVEADELVPARARQAIVVLYDQHRALDEQIETLEAEIVAHAKNDEKARILDAIPGVGPITASLVVATVSDWSVFKTGRDFAAWAGLVPRQNGTGGKVRLGKITKAGNKQIRKLLVIGATSMVHRAEHWDSALGRWTASLLKQGRPVRLVTVALANKVARVMWALMAHNDVYRPQGAVKPSAAASAAVVA